MSSNLLENPEDQGDALFNKLLFEAISEEKNSPKPSIPYSCIVPQPGFCLKTKNEADEKIFINICHAPNVPEPKDITEEELIKVLEMEDAVEFRVPMSLGDPHAELDKGGKGCTAYDVIIHTKFLQKVESSEMFKKFLISMSMEGIEGKFNEILQQEWVILKNKKSMGSLKEQNVRKESKPYIMEMDGPTTKTGNKPLNSEISNTAAKPANKPKAPEPKYMLLQEPIEGYPEFIVAEIHLPQVKTAKSFTLDVGEDRILLQTRCDIYHLDIYLSYNVIQEDCGAQFHRKSKILTITMPVQAES